MSQIRSIGSRAQASQAVYKDEVLGRYVAIQFQLEDGRIRPFVGKIAKVQISLQDDGTREHEHYVVFDDGDELWYDLTDQESLQRLTWIATPTGGAFKNSKTKIIPVKSKKRSKASSSLAKKGRPKLNRPALARAAAVAAAASARAAMEASEDDGTDSDDDDDDFCMVIPPTPPSRNTVPRRGSSNSSAGANANNASAKVTPEKSSQPMDNTTQKQRPPTLPTRSAFGGKTPRGFLSASLGVTVTPENSQHAEHQDEETHSEEEDEEIDVQETEKQNTTVPIIETINHKILSDLDTNNVALTEERLQGFFRWMVEVPHGNQNKLTTVTENNAKRVLAKVRLLASGEGIPYKNWPSDVLFYQDQHVDLSFDFDQMMDHGDQYLEAYGEDRSHGWLLKHPITKLKLYQEFLTTASQRHQME